MRESGGLGGKAAVWDVEQRSDGRKRVVSKRFEVTFEILTIHFINLLEIMGVCDC